jgi:hypothetical protein
MTIKVVDANGTPISGVAMYARINLLNGTSLMGQSTTDASGKAKPFVWPTY